MGSHFPSRRVADDAVSVIDLKDQTIHVRIAGVDAPEVRTHRIGGAARDGTRS